jgi:hypothetical protein
LSDRDELRKRRERVESSPQGGFGDASTVARELGTSGTYAPVLPAGAPAWTLRLLQRDSPESGAILAVYTLVAGVFQNPQKAAHLSADELDVLVNWYLQHWNDGPVQKPRMTVMLGAYDPTSPRDEPALTRVPPDLFTLQAHGSEAGPSSTVLDQDFRPIAARQVAEDILANPSYSAGQAVLLVVCQVGRNASYIQEIADYLSAPVYAYAADVPVDTRGNPTAFSDEAAFARARRSMDPNLILYSPGIPAP